MFVTANWRACFEASTGNRIDIMLNKILGRGIDKNDINLIDFTFTISLVRGIRSIRLIFSNMSAFVKLQNAEKPYYGFSQLEEGFHKINQFRLVKNSYSEKEHAKTLLVELEEEVLFLPKHFSADLNREDVDELNDDKQTYFLFFGGKRKNK